MLIKNHSYIGVLGLIALLIAGCKKDDPCDTPRQGENYVLSDSVKAYVNNYNSANRIIFTTLDGTEVSFDVTRKDTIVSYVVGLPCESDLFQIQSVRGTSEFIEFSLNNPILWNDPINVNLIKLPEMVERDAQENLSVSLGAYFSNSFEDGDELFYKIFNENNPHLNFLDSLVLGGKTFYHVYEWNGTGTTPKLEVKYNMSEGIVYIKDPSTGEEYVYERKVE